MTFAPGEACRETAEAPRRRVAAFDFDGTLSAGTSGIRFFRELLGRRWYAWLAVRHFPAALAYVLRFEHEASLERINRHVFRGRDAEVVRQVAQRFARETLPQSLIPASVARLKEHLAAGDRCVIVSRGYTWCLRPWAETLGPVEVLGTELEVGPDGRLTGRMPAPSCDGEEKQRRLLALLGDRTGWEIHAYGDSPGDFAMFRVADHAYVRRGAGFVRWRPDTTEDL